MAEQHKFRNLPAIVKRGGEAFMADPRLILVDPDYNVRDMTSADTIAHVDWLADEIEARGFNPEMPLSVKRRGQELVVVRGHCRLAGCMKAINRGLELPAIPVMQITGLSDIDLVFDQESSNYGLRLDEFAKGRLCLKARRLGLGDDEIAQRMHWKSAASVQQHIKMVEVIPEPVKQQVAQGDISATEAMKVVKNLPAGTDPEMAAKLIADNKAENKRLGVGKRTNNKVTASTLRRDQPKAPATPKAEALTDEEKAERSAALADAKARETADAQRAQDSAIFDEQNPTTAAIPLNDPDLASALAATPESPATFTPLLDETPPAPVHAQLQTAAERERGPLDMAGVESEIARIQREANAAPATSLVTPAELLLLDFMYAADAPSLAVMHASLKREQEEAAATGSDTVEQWHLVKAADHIGHLRFADEWESAKGKSELAQVA